MESKAVFFRGSFVDLFVQGCVSRGHYPPFHDHGSVKNWWEFPIVGTDQQKQPFSTEP